MKFEKNIKKIWKENIGKWRRIKEYLKISKENPRNFVSNFYVLYL